MERLSHRVLRADGAWLPLLHAAGAPLLALDPVAGVARPNACADAAPAGMRDCVLVCTAAGTRRALGPGHECWVEGHGWTRADALWVGAPLLALGHLSLPGATPPGNPDADWELAGLLLRAGREGWDPAGRKHRVAPVNDAARARLAQKCKDRGWALWRDATRPGDARQAAEDVRAGAGAAETPAGYLARLGFSGAPPPERGVPGRVELPAALWGLPDADVRAFLRGYTARGEQRRKRLEVAEGNAGLCAQVRLLGLRLGLAFEVDPTLQAPWAQRMGRGGLVLSLAELPRLGEVAGPRQPPPPGLTRIEAVTGLGVELGVACASLALADPEAGYLSAGLLVREG